jgi:hemerythrin-like domain-containing protein
MSYGRARAPLILYCMTQSEVRTAVPLEGANERARRAVERATAGYESHLDLETEARPVLAMLLREGALERAILLLERDGPRGRIAIMPRRADGPPSVTEIFEEDHARLDSIANVLLGECKTGRAHMGALAQMLIVGLRRHIRIEEEVLFPQLESRQGPSFRGDTMLMRREHMAIHRYLTDLGHAVRRCEMDSGRGPVDDFLRAYCGLSAVIADHNVKEERGLFPLIDRMTEATERYELFRRIVLF